MAVSNNLGIDSRLSKSYTKSVDGSNSVYKSVSKAMKRVRASVDAVFTQILADLTKADVRALSRELDLPTWNKPSFACLATRIPCGEEITEEKLHMVEEAEECLFDLGFTQVRVRHHGEIARIEVVKEEMTKLLEPDVAMIVTGRLREIGFRYITVDLDGYRTGSTNPKDTIEEENKRE